MAERETSLKKLRRSRARAACDGCVPLAMGARIWWSRSAWARWARKSIPPLTATTICPCCVKGGEERVVQRDQHGAGELAVGRAYADGAEFVKVFGVFVEGKEPAGPKMLDDGWRDLVLDDEA
jgi:hypothetical protein